MKKNLLITLSAILFFGATVYALSPSLEQKLEKQIKMQEMQMEGLNNDNNRYRGELSVIEPRAEKLHKLINHNKTSFTKLEAKIELARELLDFQKEK